MTLWGVLITGTLAVLGLLALGVANWRRRRGLREQDRHRRALAAFRRAVTQRDHRGPRRTPKL